MSVTVENEILRLLAPSGVEDAEPVWVFLKAHRKAGTVAAVDLSEAGTLHTAVLQLLLAYRPEIRGGFTDAFQRTWIAPLLTGGRDG